MPRRAPCTASPISMRQGARWPVTDTFGVRVAATVNGERVVHNVITTRTRPMKTNKAARVTMSYQRVLR